jgi:type I restriction-modification system DNA methylase subunit
MTEEQKKKLEQKLWDIANTLRGKMNADEFRDYILGFIFYKYLSERMHLYANSVLTEKFSFETTMAVATTPLSRVSASTTRDVNSTWRPVLLSNTTKSAV